MKRPIGVTFLAMLFVVGAAYGLFLAVVGRARPNVARDSTPRDLLVSSMGGGSCGQRPLTKD